MPFIFGFRKAQQYEPWPRRHSPTRSSGSPAATTTPGRSRTSSGSITSTSSKPFSPTSPASFQVGDVPPPKANPVPVEQNSRFAFCAPGSAAKEFFTKSKLPILELSHIWWVHSSGELLEDLRSSVLSDPLKPVFAGSCRTLTKMERWRWTSSAPPSTWWWPERTAMTFQRSFQRAWCQSWSTWTTQQVRRPQRFLTS